MASPPALSEATERKLHLRWTELLEQHRLTGEHLGWLDAERNRLRRIAAQAGDVTGRRVSSGVPWSEEGAADDHRGLRASVEVAEARFNDLAQEYWGVWLSGGGGYEVFAGWLTTIQRRASEELASIWKGNPGAVDRWYERACGPAVEKALMSLLNDWTARARGEELKRLERAATAKGKSPKLPEPEGAPVANDGDGTDRRPVNWGDIEIRFLSDERVQVTTRDQTETRNYAELGFEDGRSGKPKLAWVTLRTLAQSEGTIRAARRDRGWAQVEKQMQEVRKVLRQRFGIPADPLPFVKGTGYQARFKITYGASYHK